MRICKNWDPVIKKFKSRLSAWKAKNLSFWGCLTLVKSVLESLPLNFFSMFKVPTKVLGSLEGIQRRFLWAGNDSDKKINWVAWFKIIFSKSKGGLGVRSLKSLNLEPLAKWNWRALSDQFSLG
ncbi:hypothetical protein Hdeb2414_s0005g00175311 [Helianthus debilis subsp. tardiflorus]